MSELHSLWMRCILEIIAYMENTKLINLLKTFNKYELNQLVLFIESPFFNKNIKLIKLLRFIISCAPDYDGEKLTYKNVHAHLFRDNTFQKETIIKLSSKLYSLIEQFIIHNQIKANPQQQLFELLRFYSNKNLSNFFMMVLKKLRKKQKHTIAKDDNWAYNNFHLEYEYAAYLSANTDDGMVSINLQTTNDALDTLYILHKLKLLCYMKNRERLVSYEFNYTMEESFIKYVRNQKVDQEPIISLWLSAYSLLNQMDSIENYQQLKNKIKAYDNLIAIHEKRTLYTYLENAVKYIYVNYYSELFHLYKMQINQSDQYIEDFLIPVVYKNIVTVALKLEEIEWIENFTSLYTKKVSTNHPDKKDVFDLCEALINFSKQNYLQALDLLNKTRMKNLYYKLEERRLRLKIYYELSYYLLLNDSINNFRKFLSDNRTHIADYYLKANRNFINATYALFKAHTTKKENMAKFKTIIDQMEVLPEKDWLDLKVTALKY